MQHRSGVRRAATGTGHLRPTSVTQADGGRLYCSVPMVKVMFGKSDKSEQLPVTL